MDACQVANSVLALLRYGLHLVGGANAEMSYYGVGCFCLPQPLPYSNTCNMLSDLWVPVAEQWQCLAMLLKVQEDRQATDLALTYMALCYTEHGSSIFFC